MKEALRTALESYERHRIGEEAGRPNAAVLVLVYEHTGLHHVVFQKRTDAVRDHKGQISFPGGAADPEDPDLVATALRETYEEIGVYPADVEILGPLDDMVTVSNFRVTPYVGWLARYPYEWKFSDGEVAYLLEVPVEHLQDAANLVPDRRQINGQWYALPSYRFGEDLIWGATARMVANFLDLWEAVSAGETVAGRPSRVPNVARMERQDR